MKFFKLLIFLLISSCSFGQYYTNVIAPTKWTKGGFDSLFIPNRDTTRPGDITKSWIVLKGAVLYRWNTTDLKFDAISGGTSGGTYTLPIASSIVLGGVKPNNDFTVDGTGVLSIIQAKKDYWNTVGLKADQQALIDSAAAISARMPVLPPAYVFDKVYTFDGAYFDTTNHNVTLKDLTSAELEPFAHGMPAASLTGTDIGNIAELTDTSIHPSSEYVRLMIRRAKDTTYFDPLDFGGTGSYADPIRNLGGVGEAATKPDSVTVQKGVGVDTLINYYPGGVRLAKGYIAKGKDGLLTGGTVTWNTGLTYDVTAATYNINGTPYSSPSGSITLNASDATLDRTDVIALDNTGSIIKITGTPSATPAEPQIDPATQLNLTSVSIPKGSTQPLGVVSNMVYNENVSPDWTVSANGMTADANNTTAPYTGSKAISTSGWTNGQTVSFTASSNWSASTLAAFKLYIRLKSVIPQSGAIYVRFFNGGNPVSNSISMSNYGLNKALVGGYQNISMPIADFGFTGLFNKIQLYFGGTNTDGVYIDYVQFQSGVGTQTNTNYIADILKKPGTDSVFKVLNSKTVFVFKDSVGTGIDTTSISNRINLKLNIADTANIRLRAVAGTGMTITGTYPNLTFNSTASGGGSQTLQQVLTTGSTLSAQNTITMADYLRFTGRHLRSDTLVAGTGAPSKLGILTIRKTGNTVKLITIPTLQGDTATGARRFGNFYHTIDETYVNEDGQRDAVYMWGYNQDGTGNRVNTNEASLHTALESHYQAFSGAAPQFEYHIQSTALDGTLNRHFSMNVLKTDGSATAFWRLNSLNYFPTGTSSTPWFTTGSAGGATFRGTSAAFALVNSTPVPSAGTFSITPQVDGAVTLENTGRGNVQFKNSATREYNFADSLGQFFNFARGYLSYTGGGSSVFGKIRIWEDPTTSGWIEINSASAVRKMIIGNGTTGKVNFDLYNSNNLFVNGGSMTIGATTSTTPAVFDVNSTTKGSIPAPRMTKAQRDVIASPVQGLVVFVTDNGGYLSWYNGGWQKVSSVADP